MATEKDIDVKTELFHPVLFLELHVCRIVSSSVDKYLLKASIKMNSNWSSLPDIIWYRICESLTDVNDLFRLSCTNRQLHELIGNPSLWRHLIRQRFGTVLLARYCNEIFLNQNKADVLCSSNEHWIEFERQYHQLPVAILRNGWNLIVTGAQNGNVAGFAAAKRAKFHLPKSVAQLKMAMDEKDFCSLVAQQTLSTKDLPKLVYIFLSKKIRLSFALESFNCFDRNRLNDVQRPKSIPDENSESGLTAVFDSRWLAAIRGEFQSIVPGRYAIICRLKLNLLKFEQPSGEDQFTGEFTCIPEYGLMSSFEWNEDWFDSHYLTHQNQTEISQWFEEQMGIITVYALSKIHFGLRIWQIPYRKYLIQCDYIELKIIE